MTPVERGKELAKIRRANHLSQRNIAERLRLTPQAISSWEKGKHEPDWSRLPDVDEAYEAGGKVAALYGAMPPGVDENADMRALVQEILRTVQVLQGRFDHLEARLVPIEQQLGLTDPAVEPPAQPAPPPPRPRRRR